MARLATVYKECDREFSYSVWHNDVYDVFLVEYRVSSVDPHLTPEFTSNASYVLPIFLLFAH